MRIKDIGKTGGNMAFRLARCSCSGECGKCGVSQNLSTPRLQGERQGRQKENSGDAGITNCEHQEGGVSSPD